MQKPQWKKFTLASSHWRSTPPKTKNVIISTALPLPKQNKYEEFSAKIPKLFQQTNFWHRHKGNRNNSIITARGKNKRTSATWIPSLCPGICCTPPAGWKTGVWLCRGMTRHLPPSDAGTAAAVVTTASVTNRSNSNTRNQPNVSLMIDWLINWFIGV